MTFASEISKAVSFLSEIVGIKVLGCAVYPSVVAFKVDLISLLLGSVVVHIRQTAAAVERVPTDTFYVARNIDACQTGAAFKRHVLNGCNRIGYDYFAQAAAFVKH